MSFRRSLSALVLASLSCLSTVCLAGTEATSKEYKQPVECDPLPKGTTEVEVLADYFHSPFLSSGGHRPQFDYAGADIRFGLVVTPHLFENSKPFRGNLEMFLEGFGDGVTKGAGTYLTGGSLLFRYNFLSSCRLIPYIQLGGGGLHSDAVNDHTQRLIGGDFEFSLQADLGVRYLLNEHWSVLMEGGFQHISNADTASRNVGVNAIGGRLGVGYAF